MHLWISDTSPPCTGWLVLCFEKCWPTDRVSVVSPLSVTRLHTDGIHYLFLTGGKTQPWKPAQLWWFLWGYGGLQAQRFCSGALPPCSRWGLYIVTGDCGQQGWCFPAHWVCKAPFWAPFGMHWIGAVMWLSKCPYSNLLVCSDPALFLRNFRYKIEHCKT